MPPKNTNESDIDDMEDIEEEGEESEETEPAVFEPQEVLNEMHWHRRSIGDLIDMMKTPYVDLNPDYQRDVVWTPDRMTRLINSLMCKFYVPPVIFNVIEEPQGDGSIRYKRISIDGKQRLTSIRDFVNGKIPCTDSKGKRWYFCEDPAVTSKPKRRILSAKIRRLFLKLDMLCAEYSNLGRRQEEDLFSRVQLGMPLTPAEKLRASSGRWQDFAISIEKQFSSLITGIVDNRRGRGFQLILQVFKQLLKESDLDPKYSAGATALKGFCGDATFLDDEFKTTATDVFRRYMEVYEQYPQTFQNNSYQHATKFSPVEFVGVAVLIHRFPNRNARLLSGDILELRNDLRRQRQDLRSNTETWRALINSILRIEETRGAVQPISERVNHTFGSAADGATGIGEIADATGDFSIQDASGKTPAKSAAKSAPPPSSTGRKLRTLRSNATNTRAAASAVAVMTATRQSALTPAPVAVPVPAPTPTPRLEPAPPVQPSLSEPNFQRSSDTILHKFGAPPPAAAPTPVPSPLRITTPLFKDQGHNRAWRDPQPRRDVNPADGLAPYNRHYRSPLPSAPPRQPQQQQQGNGDIEARFKAVPTVRGSGGSDAWTGGYSGVKRGRGEESTVSVKRERLGPFEID